VQELTENEKSRVRRAMIAHGLDHRWCPREKDGRKCRGVGVFQVIEKIIEKREVDALINRTTTKYEGKYKR
jgi:hypothetical protein